MCFRRIVYTVHESTILLLVLPFGPPQLCRLNQLSFLWARVLSKD